MKTVVMCGNPKSGFHLTGPFDTVDEANAWADQYVASEYDWWVMPLAEPEELT
jgi:hypothetical protein